MQKKYLKFADFLTKSEFEINRIFTDLFLRIRLDWRALVDSRIPNIEKQTVYYYYFFCRKYNLKKFRFFEEEKMLF